MYGTEYMHGNLLTLGVWPCWPPPPPGQPVWTAWPCRTSRGSRVNQGVVSTWLPLETCILLPIIVFGESNISSTSSTWTLPPPPKLDPTANVWHGPDLWPRHISHSSQKFKAHCLKSFQVGLFTPQPLLFHSMVEKSPSICSAGERAPTKRNLKRKYFVEIHPFGRWMVMEELL